MMKHAIKTLATAASLSAAATLVGVAPAQADDTPAEMQHSPWLALRFEQSGKLVPLRGLDSMRSEVTLDGIPFTIVLPVRGEDDVYRITAWTDDSIFTAAERAKQTKSFDNNPNKHEPPFYFRPGTGMADTAAGSGTLMLNPEGHHYLSGLRLGPDYWRHVFHVSSVLREDADGNRGTVPLNDIDGPLYLVAWFDEDGDEKMSHGEYEFLVLNFK